MADINIASSFRDPSGFLFCKDGTIYRQVNSIYKENYNHLINSGLYKLLVDYKLLIPHSEADITYAKSDNAYKIIKPESIPFVSYPYEWCFSQLKDAALTTLKIQRIALDFGMSLKDSSSYNIQFKDNRPILIDTCSFEKYHDGRPWVAYRQFCQHFLAPLAIMRYSDIRLNQLLRIYIDGIPLDLASLLLPFHTFFKFSLLSHIHLHAKSQNYFANKHINRYRYRMSRFGLLGLIDNLESTIKKLKWALRTDRWFNYHRDSNYSSDALQHKKQLVAEFLDKVNPKVVWDLGSNIGLFSRIASDKGMLTVSFDNDPACVEVNYLTSIAKGERNILPLLLDLTNPSPNIGWQNSERMSILERGPVDTALALALIHHLCISNNLPLNEIATFFKKICNWLIIEFIPKEDLQVERLLLSREDILADYTQEVFESEFNRYFIVQQAVKIKDTERTLYLMQRR
jgi:hypothetical protein